MIGVDWGTSAFRAFRIGADGHVRDRHAAPRGIMAVEGGDFAGTLAAEVVHWLADGENCVLLSGMIGSRQGWQEAAYLACPADVEDIAGSLAKVPFEAARVRLVPGLSTTDAAGVPEVMRGEETQIAGLLPSLARDCLICLPGTHSKWARIAAGRIDGFTTHMTGEIYAALRDHTILGRMIRQGPPDRSAPGQISFDHTAFDRGLEAADAPGGLLHHLFGVRTRGLFGTLSEDAAGGFLSGLLIGHEVREAEASGRTVHLIGSTALCGRYGRAIERAGGFPVIEDEDAAARGLARIGELAEWD